MISLWFPYSPYPHVKKILVFHNYNIFMDFVARFTKIWREKSNRAVCYGKLFLFQDKVCWLTIFQVRTLQENSFKHGWKGRDGTFFATSSTCRFWCCSSSLLIELLGMPQPYAYPCLGLTSIKGAQSVFYVNFQFWMVLHWIWLLIVQLFLIYSLLWLPCEHTPTPAYSCPSLYILLTCTWPVALYQMIRSLRQFMVMPRT